jgi:hypothetical protein
VIINQAPNRIFTKTALPRHTSDLQGGIGWAYVRV